MPLCAEDPAEHGGRGIAPFRRSSSRIALEGESQTLRHAWPMAAAARNGVKLASFIIDDSETDVLSHLDFLEQHRTIGAAQQHESSRWNG